MSKGDSKPMSQKTGESRHLGGIDWTVIAQDGDKCLLLATELLAGEDGAPIQRKYHEERIGVTWESSDLRAWLNGDFLKRFSDEELATVLPMRVVNYDNEAVNTPGGENTIDRVFCLSSEGYKALIEKSDRHKFCDGWLRTPGNVENMATFVAFTAQVWQEGAYVDTEFTVRPALWVGESSNYDSGKWFFSAVGFGKMSRSAKEKLACAYLAALSCGACDEVEEVNAYLRRNFKKIANEAFRSPDVDAVVRGASKLGLISAGNLKEMVDIAKSNGLPKAEKALMECAPIESPEAKKPKQGNIWSAALLKKQWCFREEGDVLSIDQYKGTSPIAVAPRIVGRKAVTSIHQYFSLPTDKLVAHIILPETVGAVDWGKWDRPVVHALKGSPAFQSAEEAGLVVMELQYSPEVAGSYERAAEERMGLIDAMGPAAQIEAFRSFIAGGLNWDVVAVENNRALLITKKPLYDGLWPLKMNYDDKGINPWEHSTLRAWLNGDFLKRFSEKELERIPEVELSTSYNPDLPDTGDNDAGAFLKAILADERESATVDIPIECTTVDKVFCLSYEEVARYSSQDPNAFPAFDEHTSWWLRNTGGSPKRAMTVYGESVNVAGTNKRLFSVDHVNVRPALWIKIDEADD